MDQIKSILPSWRNEMQNNKKEFKQFYSYVFQYSRVEGQKSISNTKKNKNLKLIFKKCLKLQFQLGN